MRGRLNPCFSLNGILVDMLYGECSMARSSEAIGVTYMQFSKVMHDFMPDVA